MRGSAIVVAVCSLAWPAVAGAQTYVAGGESILRPAGYGWRNQFVVPDGTCGCGVPVRTDTYDDCCRPCGLRPLCFLKRVGQMLDCLLPCNRCRGIGAHGCVLGGRCGAPCGCDSCGHGGYLPGQPGPALSDPFLDDPAPPKPAATPATEVRRSNSPKFPAYQPQGRVAAAPAPSSSPYKIVRGGVAQASNLTAAPRTATRTAKAEHSVLRRPASEPSREPAQLRIDPSQAAPLVRSQSPSGYGEFEIPHNPLRD